MERKPYYIIRYINNLSSKLREGIVREVYPHNGNAIQLYLTDEELQKYDPEVVRQILRPYAEITLKRSLCLPPELILYAISEVLYESKEESDE